MKERGRNDRTGVVLKQPTGISIFGAMVYITDSKNNRVVVFDTSGNYISTIGEGVALKLPWDNQVDCFGNLFIADVHNHRILEFNPWGDKLLSFGVKGDGAGQFRLPHGITLSSDGKYLYVCDTYNNRVQKFLMYFEPQKEYESGVMAMNDKPLKGFILYQNYPNPFREKTTIRYMIPDTGDGMGDGKSQKLKDENEKVSLKIYDVSGRLVRQWGEETIKQSAQIVWDGTDDNRRSVSSGVYFYKLNARNFSDTKKMILLR